jgi:hypothetical protein
MCSTPVPTRNRLAISSRRLGRRAVRGRTSVGGRKESESAPRRHTRGHTTLSAGSGIRGTLGGHGVFFPWREGVRADCESTCPKGRECWMRKDLIAPKRRDR